MLGWGQVPFQVHAVVQQPEHVNHIAPVNAADAEHDEVSALAPVLRDMECPDIVADFRPLLDPHDGGAGAQGFQCG
jgi:hypothetical protein